MHNGFDINRLRSAWSWVGWGFQLLRDLKLAGFILAILMLSRICLFFIFGMKYGADADLREYGLWMLRGFQFDLRVAIFAILPTFCLSFLGWKWSFAMEKLRLYWGSIVSVVTLLIVGLNIGFFAEYHDQFNQWIFGIVYDDLNAILKTVWGAYPVIYISLTFLIAAFLICKGLRLWLDSEFGEKLCMRCFSGSFLPRLILCGLLALLMVGGLRGSLGRRPLQRKDVAITKNHFFNQTIPNPYYSLYFAVKDHRLRHSAKGLEFFIPSGDIANALSLVFPEAQIDDTLGLDAYFNRQVKRTSEARPKPQHVFLIVMESQDQWPLLDKYSSLNLVPNLKHLSQEGIAVKAFVSSGGGTMPSMNSIILGMPNVEVNANYQPSTRTLFPTAIAKQFKDLGYTTRFFYGGYLSWQKIGEFSKNQGFDEAFGGSDMGAWVGNEWGVEDAQLFKFIEEKVKSSDVPTFNLILTTSNHPRYSVDIAKAGFPLKEIPVDLSSSYDGSVDLNILGHAWYADNCVGSFVGNVEKAFPDALFAITGDHWSRHFLNKKPTLYERKSVPCIFYSKDFLEGLDLSGAVAGSHIDIAPTLIELIAPDAFEYSSMGASLLVKNDGNHAFGCGILMTPTFLWEIGNSEPAESLAGVATSEEPGALIERYNAWHALGWWRIMKGSALAPHSK